MHQYFILECQSLSETNCAKVSDDDQERKVASRHDGIKTSHGHFHGREFVEEAGPGRGVGDFNELYEAAGESSRFLQSGVGV